MSNLFDQYQLPTELSRRCGDVGAALNWASSSDTPSCSRERGTNNFTINFPLFGTPLTHDKFMVLKASSIHEPLHVLRYESFDICEKHDVPKFPALKMIHNVLEDEVMEREHCAIYRGDRECLGEAHTILHKSILDKLKTGTMRIPEEDTVTAKMFATMVMSACSRSKWDASLLGTVSEYHKTLPPKILDSVNILIKEGYDVKLDNTSTPQQVYELAVEIYDRLFDDEEKKKDEKRGEQVEKAQGKGGKSEEEGTTLKAECDAAQKEGTIHWTQLVKAHGNDMGDQDYLPTNIDYEGSDFSANWTPYPPNKIDVVDYQGGKALSGSRNSRALSYDSSSHEGRINSAQIRKYIQAKNRVAFKTERLTGKIHNKNLYRIGVPVADGDDWNTRIFKKRQDKVALNTCVTLVVDWSGSMCGQKMVVAAHSAVALYETFGVALNLPTEIISFSAGWNQIHHGIIKSFETRRIRPSVILDRFRDFEQYTSGNADADALMWSYARLAKRKEQRKIMIVLSDGSPSDAYSGSCSSGLADTIDFIRSKRVELHGIGIQDVSAKIFYGRNSITINKLQELAPAILSILKQSVEGTISNGRR